EVEVHRAVRDDDGGENTRNNGEGKPKNHHQDAGGVQQPAAVGGSSSVVRTACGPGRLVAGHFSLLHDNDKTRGMIASRCMPTRKDRSLPTVCAAYDYGYRIHPE